MTQTDLDNQQLLTKRWAIGENIQFPYEKSLPVIRRGREFIVKNCYKCGAEVERDPKMIARPASCFDCKRKLKMEISREWKKKSIHRLSTIRACN